MSERKDFVGSMYATTTSKDWGFGPVSGKGGRTTNSTIPEKK